MAKFYAKAPDGSDALLSIVLTGFTQSLQQNGWCKLPNGLLFQWRSESIYTYIPDLETNSVVFYMGWNISFSNKVIFGLLSSTTGIPSSNSSNVDEGASIRALHLSNARILFSWNSQFEQIIYLLGLGV